MLRFAIIGLALLPVQTQGDQRLPQVIKYQCVENVAPRRSPFPHFVPCKRLRNVQWYHAGMEV